MLMLCLRQSFEKSLSALYVSATFKTLTNKKKKENIFN